MVTPIGLNHIGGNYFWIWAIVCASFVPLTYFFGVETSGRSLEQIDQVRKTGTRARHLHSITDRTCFADVFRRAACPDGLEQEPYSRYQSYCCRRGIAVQGFCET